MHCHNIVITFAATLYCDTWSWHDGGDIVDLWRHAVGDADGDDQRQGPDHSHSDTCEPFYPGGSVTNVLITLK